MKLTDKIIILALYSKQIVARTCWLYKTNQYGIIYCEDKNSFYNVKIDIDNLGKKKTTISDFALTIIDLEADDWDILGPVE